MGLWASENCGRENASSERRERFHPYRDTGHDYYDGSSTLRPVRRPGHEPQGLTFGNNKVEAVESSRVAMEKMEREIRQASAYNSPSDMHLFDQWTANQIRFGNDL